MTRGTLAHGAPIRSSVIVVDGFLPPELADAMRQDIEAHFARPQAHEADAHQIWNYSFVPERHTCLRTAPEKIIVSERVEAFLQAIGPWALSTLGMGAVTRPTLSLYVAGCRQSGHTDADSGRFGFCYSLSRDGRRATGGEILVMREGSLLGDSIARSGAGRGLYDAIEGRFNRLIVFDNRLPQAVERVDGPMDPVEGCFMLHGHINEAGTAVAGALTPEAVAEPIATALRGFAAEISARAMLYHGPLALQLVIDTAGTVTNCRLLLDRVMHRDPGHTEWDPLLAKPIQRLRELQFPSAGGETSIIQPIVFGGPLSRHQ